jgi:hypothetical protein
MDLTPLYSLHRRRYRIAYAVNTTAALLLSARIMLNGIANTAST